MTERKFEKETVYDAESKTKIVSLKPIEIPKEAKTTWEIHNTTNSEEWLQEWVPLEVYQRDVEKQRQITFKYTKIADERIQKLEAIRDKAVNHAEALLEDNRKLEVDNQKLYDKIEDYRRELRDQLKKFNLKEKAREEAVDVANEMILKNISLEKELATAKQELTEQDKRIDTYANQIRETKKILNEHDIGFAYQGCMEWLDKLKAILTPEKNPWKEIVKDVIPELKKAMKKV